MIPGDIAVQEVVIPLEQIIWSLHQICDIVAYKKDRTSCDLLSKHPKELSLKTLTWAKDVYLSRAVKGKWAHAAMPPKPAEVQLATSAPALSIFPIKWDKPHLSHHSHHDTISVHHLRPKRLQSVLWCCVNLRNGKIFCQVTASPGSAGHLLCAIRRRSSRRTWRFHIQLIQVHSLQRGSKFPKIFESMEEASVSMKKESQSSHITSETHVQFATSVKSSTRPCNARTHPKD